MKYLIYFLGLLPFGLTAQTPNYIKVLTYRDSTQTTDINKAQTSITYYDGLGRPIQQVAGKMATSGKDLVTHIAYDGFGRQTKEFLPYPSAASDLSYQGNAATDVLTYYSTPLSGPQETTGNPYSEKFFEPSPLNRVLKQAAPGNAWLGNPDPYNNNDHSVKLVYQANVASEVKKLKATATWNASTQIYDIAFVSDGFYPANQLYKTITKNENWISGLANTSEEFKNKEGQVVLKKTYNGSVTHETYYIYDQFGNLTYVLSPAANGSNTYVNTLGYQYKYDRRNRLAEKKLPGKQWEFIVYDPLDRPILSGPALTPFGGQTSVASNLGWLMTVYDAFGRVAITGWYQAPVTTSTRQAAQAGMGATVLTAVRGSGTIDGVSVGYNNLSLPTGFKLLTVNYYDDYTWPGAPTLPLQIEGQNIRSTVKGLPTGSWVRVLNTGTADKEISYTLYDSRARAIRTNSANYLGGYTQIDIKLDFDATPQYNITRHKRVAADTELVVREDFTYDAQDRLKTHRHKINSGTTVEIASNTYHELGKLIRKGIHPYLVGRSEVPAQVIDYKYNIRGWLTDINNVDASLALGGTDLFAFRIGYNNPVDNTGGALDIKGLYNGNISETYWRSRSDNVLRKYSYKYDDLNRLTDAYYQRPTSSSTANIGSYDEKDIIYDKNGNILRLTRTGGLDDATNKVVIDNLQYTYSANTNQILKVEDNSTSPQGFTDVAGTVEYTYDTNGNMLTDVNKGITSIKYNHLNLPTEIIIKGNKIEYLYNAAGKKLKKTVTQGSNIVYVDYFDGFQYKGGVLQFFPTAEGYIDNTVTSSGVNVYNYVYHYKDHLGNVRLNYTVSNSGTIYNVGIKEQNHYYPFGLKHLNYNMDYLEYQEIEGDIELYPPLSSTGKLKHNYKYNGKEQQDELGLNMYDYGARNYDPALGRWMNIDPQAEKGYNVSPYNYALNNPVSVIDIDGLYPTPILIYNKTKDAYHLTNAASHLLSLVSGVDKRKIQNAEIKMRGAGHMVPAFSADDGGGAITLGRPNYHAIYYTENWFDDNASNYNGHGYGQDINGWLNHLSHEVGHLNQIDVEGSLTSYVFEMLKQYGSAGSHNGAPYEKQADVGQNEFIAFNSFINKSYGANSLANLFQNHQDPTIVKTVDKWWQAYETSKGTKATRTQSFLEGLQTNLNNYSAGTYIYNGTNWVIKN